jgi:hypothetical protein
MLATGCAAKVDDEPGPSREVDPSLIDNPIDERGYSIVGEDVHPPLYQRVETKCVPILSGNPRCELDPISRTQLLGSRGLYGSFRSSNVTAETGACRTLT